MFHLNGRKIDKLKVVLTQTPALIQPESSKKYVVYSDASYIGIGCVLMQGGKVVAYALRQWWTELLKDYDCVIEYHPGKANMTDLRAMFARLSLVDAGGLLAELQVKPTLANEIKAK
ncbi:RNA-directed DNA polymerase-like protein [Gossypium australe]|uniref:RNA-directed DNA polymerase-like protein n=1 Tax=Gossypium australe TaxID=47621 RepID=A0A5B6VP66_9ROSI|nr:RNA-directed DNA polymerase-like protein [Gossypium australe]